MVTRRRERALSDKSKPSLNDFARRAHQQSRLGVQVRNQRKERTPAVKPKSLGKTGGGGGF